MIDRLHILKAKLQRNQFLKYSSWEDVRHELFRWYGRHKRSIKARMRREREGDLLRVEIDGISVYWPYGAGADMLAYIYFEIYNKSNNHYFDIAGMEIKKGDIVLDCGACEGYFTRKALEGGAEKVYCIEPASALVNCLNKTFADEIINGSVAISSCPLTGKNEVVVYYENLIDPAIGKIGSDIAFENDTSLVATEMITMTIDEFCSCHSLRKLDFIKADVEGAEVDLIYGAEKTIRELRPALAIAVYHKPENANLIVEYIERLSLGYTIRVKGAILKDKVPRPVMVHCYHKQ